MWSIKEVLVPLLESTRSSCKLRSTSLSRTSTEIPSFSLSSLFVPAKSWTVHKICVHSYPVGFKDPAIGDRFSADPRLLTAPSIIKDTLTYFPRQRQRMSFYHSSEISGCMRLRNHMEPASGTLVTHFEVGPCRMLQHLACDRSFL